MGLVLVGVQMRVLALLLAASVSPAMAQVTTLISIPIAETKGVRELELGYLLTGVERNIDTGYSHYAYGVMGINPRIEIGASTDFQGSSVWGFKVKLLESRSGSSTLSIGAQNIRAGKSDIFAVGCLRFGSSRLHLGWSRDDTSRIVLGFDCEVSGGLTFAIDHSSASGGSTWSGLFYCVPGFDGLSANLNVQFPNDRSEGLHHSFGLIYGFRF